MTQPTVRRDDDVMARKRFYIIGPLWGESTWRLPVDSSNKGTVIRCSHLKVMNKQSNCRCVWDTLVIRWHHCYQNGHCTPATKSVVFHHGVMCHILFPPYIIRKFNNNVCTVCVAVHRALVQLAKLLAVGSKSRLASGNTVPPWPQENAVTAKWCLMRGLKGLFPAVVGSNQSNRHREMHRIRWHQYDIRLWSRRSIYKGTILLEACLYIIHA